MTIQIYQSTCVANKLLKIASKNNKTFTPMQIIKLVYLAHAWMLALHMRPLIEEEVEAWKYGPVIPQLYQAIKNYKSNPVVLITCQSQKFDKDAQDIIQQVYDKYGHFDGIELSMLTHEKNSPWEIARRNGNSIISNDLIMHHYKKLVQNG